MLLSLVTNTTLLQYLLVKLNNVHFLSASASPEDATATAEDGPWVITLDLPSYLPAMQHLKSREIREQLYRAYVSRASSGEHDNTPLIQRILQIKAETSAMLGYKSFAEKSLSSKMAPSMQTDNISTQ